ncbi:MAG: phosphatidate cytidylyltransferase [Anaerovoracaceae bacterium]|jgi:phosphatidate cytidylyltransferase
MKTRIISGCIMVPFFIFIFLGGYWLRGFMFVISLMAVYEFYKGFHAMDVKPSYPIAVCSAVLLYGIELAGGGTEWFMLWLFASVVASLLYLFNIEKRKLEDAMATITGIFYVIFFMFCMILVDGSGESTHLMVWIVLFSAFGTDIFAYFGGVAFGKHKLCPKISPKKTVEGSICGILGAMLLCGLIGYFFIRPLFMHCIILGAAGGIITQFGDLTASIFKRKMGIKDYGHIIPGHGGIMDRFDSVLFAAPMVYFYITFVIL